MNFREQIAKHRAYLARRRAKLYLHGRVARVERMQGAFALELPVRMLRDPYLFRRLGF